MFCLVLDRPVPMLDKDGFEELHVPRGIPDVSNHGCGQRSAAEKDVGSQLMSIERKLLFSRVEYRISPVSFSQTSLPTPGKLSSCISSPP